MTATPVSPVATGAPANPVIAYATTKPLSISTHNQTEMYLCSVYPTAKRATQRHSTTFQRADGSFGVSCDTTYTLPAAPRDSYSTLTVYNAMTPIMGWSSDGPSQNTLVPGHIPVRVVAEDLVRQWAGQTIASREGYGPGIGIIAGEVPTQDELAFLRERQRRFFEWMVNDGNDKMVRGEIKNITNIHRSAAYWLLGSAAEQLAWYPKLEQRQVKDCPACAKQILAAALTCEHCSLDLIGWYERFPHLTADPHVKLFIDTKNAAVKASEVASIPPPPPVQNPQVRK